MLAFRPLRRVRTFVALAVAVVAAAVSASVALAAYEDGQITKDGGYGNADREPNISNGVVYWVRGNNPWSVVKWTSGTSFSTLWTSGAGEQVKFMEAAGGKVAWATGNGRVFIYNGSSVSGNLAASGGTTIQSLAFDGTYVAFSQAMGGSGDSTNYEAFRSSGGTPQNVSNDGGTRDLNVDIDGGKVVFQKQAFAGGSPLRTYLWPGSGGAFELPPAPGVSNQWDRTEPAISGNYVVWGTGSSSPSGQWVWLYRYSTNSTLDISGNTSIGTDHPLVSWCGVVYANLYTGWKFRSHSGSVTSLIYGDYVQMEGCQALTEATLLVDGPSGSWKDVSTGVGHNATMSGGEVVWEGHYDYDIWIYADISRIPYPRNQPPNAEADGPYHAYRSGCVSLNGSGTTDPNDPVTSLTYEWDLNGVGGYDATGRVTTACGSALPTATRTIWLHVTDPHGAWSNDSATLNIYDPPADGTAPIQDMLGGTVSDDAGTGAQISMNAGALPMSSLTFTIGEVPEPPGGWSPVIPGGFWRISAPFSFHPHTGDGTVTFDPGLWGTVGIPTLFPSSSYAGSGSLSLYRRPTGSSDGFVPDPFGVSLPNWSGSFASINLSRLASEYVWVLSNSAPTAEAGGPYTVAAGDMLTLAGSSSDPDGPLGDFIASYDWDLDGDGEFDDAAGASPDVGPMLGSGTYTIWLRVTDSLGATGVDSADLTIVNASPDAAPDAYATGEDVTLIVPAPGVLDNDTDLEGDYPLAVDSYTAPAVGTLTMDAPGDGSFTYEPAPDHNGVVTFTYRARDSMGGVSEPATVTITVNPVNDPPEATPQHVSTPEDTDLAIQLGGTDIDGDPLTPVITALPAAGTLFQTADGSTPSDEITSVPATVTDALARVVYRPAPNEYDSPYAQFEFVVNDGAVDSAPATVTVNVLPVNDAPVADPQSVTTDEDVSVDFTLSGSDVEGSSLTSAMWSPPAHGSVVVNADGTGTYTPDADYNGADSFEFTVFDGELTSEPAVVSITVNPVNDPPVIVPRDFVTDEDTPLVLVLEAGDVDGDVLVFSVTTPPSHGVLALSPDGTGTYEPDLDYFGPDSFEYEVWDGAVAVAGASAITVNPVNDAPVASDVGPVTAIEGEPLAITLPASDVDSPTLTFEVVAGPGHGVVTIAGEIATYTADRYDYTPDGFTFRAFDGELYSEAAVVSITVIPAYPTDYALFASGSKWASVGLQARVEGGLVGGNRNVVIHSFAQVEGVSAGGDVSVMARARTGDIVAGGTVKVHRGAEVGTVTEGAVVYAPRMPEVNAEPGSQDIKRSVRDARRGPLDLAPGAYGKVDTAIQDRLILHGGEYHFRELNVDLASKITVDLSNGQPLLVRVAGNLNFGIGVRMEVVGGDASRVAFLVGGRHARLGMSGTYCGTFAAPEGKVYVGFGADLTGAAWGEDIDAATRARITRSPYTAW